MSIKIKKEWDVESIDRDRIVVLVLGRFFYCACSMSDQPVRNTQAEN